MKNIAFLILCISCQYLYSAEKNPEEKAAVYDPNQVRTVKLFSRNWTDQGQWFISFNTGAQAYFGDHDKQIGVFKRLTPRFELGGGKWLTNLFAVRLSVSGYELKGLTQNTNLSTGEVDDASRNLYHQKYNFVSSNFDFLFNWRESRQNYNPTFSYNKNYTYNIMPYIGVGVMFATDKGYSTRFSPSLGLLQTFRINEYFDFNIDVRGNVNGDSFDGDKGRRKFDGLLSTQIGVTYNFW